MIDEKRKYIIALHPRQELHRFHFRKSIKEARMKRKSFDINAFAQEVHKNAIEHGWYTPESPTAEERVAAIHSEWAEAFQEWRKNGGAYNATEICTAKDKLLECEPQPCSACDAHVNKPYGYAVELMDGVLRILEWAAAEGIIIDAKFDEDMINECDGFAFADIIVLLHSTTAQAYTQTDKDALFDHLLYCAQIAMNYIEHIGIDPVGIMREKHEYNKSRPYRHGGKRC